MRKNNPDERGKSINAKEIWNDAPSLFDKCCQVLFVTDIPRFLVIKPAQSARARRACALRALGLLLADGTPTVGGGKTF